jgi:hypothetical protein
MRTASALVLSALAAGLVVGTASAETLKFQAQLNGASEVPPTISPGQGSATVTLDMASRILDWTVQYSGLSSTPTAAHFHGPAAPGQNAPAELPLKAPLTSPIKGSAILTAAQIADLEGGKMYLSLNTAQTQNGEIRGQVVRAR